MAGHVVGAMLGDHMAEETKHEGTEKRVREESRATWSVQPWGVGNAGKGSSTGCELP